MNAILEQINSAGLKFVEFAQPMFVQSVVLIVILLLADFALRKKVRAVFRYWIWLLVLLKLILPTSLSSPMSLGYFFGDSLTYVDTTETPSELQADVVEPAPANVPPFIDLTNIEADRFTRAAPPVISVTEQAQEPAIISQAAQPAVSATPLSWQGAVFLVWLTVVIVMTLLLLQRAIFVKGLVAQAKEASNSMADMLDSCRSSMSIKRKLDLKISPNAASPAVCGLFRPVILIPQNLTSSLSVNQLRAVLLHELAHIRRGDLFVNLAQTVLQIIYFYNPLLWLANCIIRRIREQAVDEMVLVAMGEKAPQYPQTLVSVAKLAFERPVLSLRLIGVVESKNALSGRIKHILNRPIPKRAKLGIVGLVIVVIIGAILLPMASSMSDSPKLVIKGVVKDAQTNEPIAGAKVFDDGYAHQPLWEQIRPDQRSQWGAITNEAGRYSFLTWPEHHSIKVVAPGYKSQRRSLYSGHFVFNKKDQEVFNFALKGLLIKFTELRKGVADKISVAEKVSVDDMTIWSNSYKVEFVEGEDMLVAAEVYQAGKPMRIMGRKIFAGSDKPEILTLKFVRNFKNVARTSIAYDIKFQLGRQFFRIPEFPVYTAQYFSGDLWDWFQGEASRSLKTRRKNEEYTGLEPLFRYCSCGGRERESEDQAKFWVPGSNATPIMSNHCVVLRMIPLSRIKYLYVEPIGGYQGLDGKIIPPTNFTLEKADEIADAYRNMIGEYIAQQESNNDFTATLPNGVMVELIGVCEHPSEGKQWWRPDGTMLPEAPYEKTNSYADPENDDDYEIAVRFHGYPFDSINYSSKRIPEAINGSMATGSALINGKRVPGLTTITASFPKNQSTVAIPLGVAAGPWKSFAVSDGRGERSTSADNNVVRFEEAYQKEDKTYLMVWHNFYNTAFRLVAKDVYDNLHTGNLVQGGLGKGVEGWEYAFSPQLSEISLFRFETRPYEWIEFKNVSLKPNFKTDVQVKFEETDKNKLNVPKISNFPAKVNDPKYVSRFNIKRSASNKLEDAFEDDKLSFEEVVGFIFKSYNDGSVHVIDFDTNRIIQTPDDLDMQNKQAVRLWAESEGVDAIIHPNRLTTTNMAIIWGNEKQWGSISTDMLTKLKDSILNSGEDLITISNENSYYVFKSSDGRIGVVGLSFHDTGTIPRRLLIKYKLLKTDVQGEVVSVLSEATGRVVDVNGQGVSGATLEFYKYSSEKKTRKIATIMSDKTGRFHIPVVKTGESLSVWISAPGFAKRESVRVYSATDGLYSDDTSSTDNLILKLKRLGIIEGQVIGPNGNSLAWAPLSLSTTVRYPDHGESTRNHFRAITDEQGYFRMEVPPGTHLLYYPWSGPSKGEVSSGMWRAFHRPDERWPSAPIKGVCAAKVIKLGDGELRGIVIDLSKSTCAIEGQVHDTHGRVVADAMVSLYWVYSSGCVSVNGKGYPPVATDAVGRYRLQNLPPGDWHIRTWHDKVKQQSKPVPIELKPGRTIQQDLTLSGQVELDATRTDMQVEPEKDWVVEEYGQTKLLSDKEKLEVENWVSIVASVVKNNGRYLVPDRGLTLKDLIKAAGYNKDKLAESYVELSRRSQGGNITMRSTYSRNLKTLLSGEESDIVLKPHDTVSGGYIEPSANGVEFWSGYHFSEIVEMTVNDDGAKVDMFADLDTGKLITPPDTLNYDDVNALLRWIKDNGVDVMGETAPAVHGLVGFNMYAARVDNYFWDARPREVTDRLMVRIDDPVLLSVENLLPVTYLIKTSKYKMGILQILGFSENPKGIRIRYKLLNKEAVLKPDTQLDNVSVVGGWRYIGPAIPPDFNDTMILTEHINLGSIGHDAEGKTFITFIRDGQEAQNRQYRFVLFTKDGDILEPDGHIVLGEGKRLEEKFTFDEPFITRRLKGFRFQARPSPPSGLDNISSQLQKSILEVIISGTLLPSNLAPPGRYAVELDGVDDYLLVSDSPSLRLEPPFTIEMWIKTKLPPDASEYRGGWAVISKGFTVGTPRAYLTGFGIKLDRFQNEPSKLQIDFCKSNNSGIYSAAYAGYPLTNGVSEWIHIYHVFEGEYYRSTPGHPLVMGKFLIPTENPFKGLLGEVRLWNGARTRQELRQYENVALTGKEPGLAACWTFEQTEGQIAYDISSNRNHARLGKSIEADNADPKWVNAIDISEQHSKPVNVTDTQVIASSILEPIGRRALSFDGVDDYLHVEANPTLTLKPPFTIEMWLKPDFSEVERLRISEKLLPYLSLMRKGKRLFQEKKIQAGGFMMFVEPSSRQDGKCYGNLYLGNEDGLFYQVDGDQMQLAHPGWFYVSMNCTRETYMPIPKQPLIIGQNIVPGCFPFKGDIAEIRIWSGVRSGNQVARYRNKPLKGTEPSLVACWDFKRSGGQIVYDISPNGNHARLGKFTGPDDADPKWIDLQPPSPQPDLKTDGQVSKEILENIQVLRQSRLDQINETSIEQTRAISAMQELVRIGELAVPDLVSELRRDNNWLTKSLIAFVLRAIGDERLVPALIEVLNQSKYRGEYGIYIQDDELATWMLDRQHREPDENDRKSKQIIIAGPVIEITKTLEKITGHSEGPDWFSPETVEITKQRWQKWVDLHTPSPQPGQKTDVQVGLKREKKITCRTSAELMDNLLELARNGDPAAGRLFAENVAPDVARLLEWWGGEIRCREVAEEYQQMRTELLAGLTEQRKQFYKKVRIWSDRGDEVTQVGAKAYGRLIKSDRSKKSWIRTLLMRKGENGAWQIVGLFNHNKIGGGLHAIGDYLNPWSPSTHPAWGDSTEFNIRAYDITKGCYIDFDNRKLHRMTSSSNLTREMCVRLGIDGKCGSHEIAGGGGLIGIDLKTRMDGNFTWGLMTPLNVQLAPSMWMGLGSGGGGPMFFKTREGNIGVMGVSGNVNNYYIKFKMLNPAYLDSTSNILKAVQGDPREAAAYFLTGVCCRYCRHGELDVSSFTQRPELVAKVKSHCRGFGGVRLDTVYAANNMALVVTSKSSGDEYRRFVLSLARENNRWLVTDVQIETREEEGGALRDFLKEYPDARIVPNAMRVKHTVVVSPEQT